MSDKEKDQIIWNTIVSFYNEPKKKNKRIWTSEQLEQTRKMNQEESYWCREDGKDQKLFIKPEQRLMARLIKSFLNTSYKKGFRNKINDENWFDKPDIIDFLQGEIENSTSTIDTKLKDFVTDACSLLTKLQAAGTMQMTNYESHQEQKAYLEALHGIVNQEYESRSEKKELQVSGFEQKFLDIMKERNKRFADRIPFDLIFKMQKLIRGFGIALTCDFLKETHLCYIAKPDVHLRHVFSMIDRIPYSEDLILVNRISEFAENVNKSPQSDDFCNSGPYYIDKIIWILCSRNKKIGDDKNTPIPSFKNELMDTIADVQKRIAPNQE